jgi:hypothetical protein
MSRSSKTGPNRATGIVDLADFFPCQNQVLSRLVNDQKIAKKKAKNCSK